MITPMEQDTRILIDRSLENLGWRLTGADKNVYLEQPRTEQERRKLDGRRPDYVLYSSDADNRPLIVIEAKRRGVRLDSALEQGISYARILQAPLVFATDGVSCRSFHTTANRTPVLNGSEIDELIRETLALRYLNSYEVNTISPAVMYSRKELINVFDEANNMLRGEGLRAGIERFGEFANILFLKLVDESERVKRESGIPTDFDMACSWDIIKDIPPSARIEYINKTVYERLNALYKTEIFTPLQIRNVEILKDIMDKLDPLTLTDLDSDIKGDAFEYFLRSTTSTQNDLGEYFTPRHIVKTMVRLVNPQIGEKVYDPFCGTGGFLIEAFRHIYGSMARTAPNLETLRERTIYGNEITNTARITKMNMILAGDGHSNIKMQDSLEHPVDGNARRLDGTHDGFDVVITNMPYSQPTKYGNLYDLPSSNGDSICVQHCIKAVNSTSPNGRMALVVPEGFLFRKDLTRVREYMLRNCRLQSIISLPQGVFLPYTGVKTNILYAVKVNRRQSAHDGTEHFWYFDVKNDGYTLNNQRRKIDGPSDLTMYEEYIRLDDGQAEEMKLAGFEMIPFERVRENDYILAGNRYRQQKAISSKYKAVSIGDVVTLVNGYTFPLNMQGQQGTIPFYKISDMNSDGNETEMFISNNYVSEETARIRKWEVFPSGTVIFPKAGAAIATNKKRILSIPALFNSNIMGMMCSDSILPKYMLFLLNSINIMEWASLSNPPTITREVVAAYKIPLPQLEVQRSIITELEGYQNIIAGAKKIIASYVPHLPHYEGQTVSLGSTELFDIESGGTPSSTEAKYWNGNIDWITLADLPPEDYVTEIKSSERKITQEGLTHSSAKLLPVGTVVVSTRATIGRVGIARVPLATNQGFKNVIIKDTSIIAPEFLALLLRAKTEEMNDLASGATFKEISKSNFATLTVNIPSMEEQQKILDEIRHEQALIEPSRQLIKVFTDKIQATIKALWEN